MAKDGAVSGAQADEIESILQEGKKKELNFILMKAKGGVVMKCGPSVKGFPKLRAEAKEAGGMPALSVCGRLTVSGRTMNMTAVEDDPPEPSVMRKLAAQSKKHFKALGIRPAKMVMTLPNGEIIDSDSVPDEEEGVAEEGDETPVGAPGDTDASPDPAEALRAELTERLKALVPQVKDAIGKAVQGADRLAAALKAAGTEIAGGALEKAAQILDAVEKNLKSPAVAPEGDGGSNGLKESLLSEFRELSGELRTVLSSGEKAVAGKAQQFVQMFKAEIDGDLKKAGSILSALKRFVEIEVGRLASQTEKGSGDGETVGKDGPSIIETVTGKVGEVVDKIVDTAKETVGGVVESVTSTPDELKQRAGLEALGLTVEQRNELMEKLKKDPKAIETFKKDKMKAAGVPEDRQAALLKMSDDNPKAFAAALSSLGTMEKGGAVDISADAVQKSLEDLEKARKETEAKQKLADEAAKKLAEVNKVYGEAFKAVGPAQERASLAAKAIEDLKSRIGDPKALTPEQREKFAAESRKLMNENELAKAALAKAIEAQKQASMDYADASDKNGKAQEALDKAKEGQAGKQAVQDAKDGKKALLDAMTFGPLAGGKLSDEDKAKFADAFGKNAKVADGMLSMTGSAKNPSALAANASFLAGKASDGFADKDGNKLDLPPDQMNQMALNAARMGDEAGGDYFKNFGEYLKSGKQLAPDPTGGMDGPLADAKEETKRKNKVSLARSQAMGAAAVKPDGTVDFNSDAAKAQMDHMMFHPGSLKTFMPQMNMKMAETKALFENPATKDKANETIKGTKLPPNGAPGKNAAQTLIAGTTGKDKGALTDNDAKAAVLGAMMTPLSQGPVGSCFSTAPVRGIRETDPLRAMDEYSKIASTGQYTAKSGDVYPANTHLPEGENPLMRSFEYSVATAAADITNSVEKKRLTYGMFRNNDAANNLQGLKGIVGDDAWNNKVDGLTGDVTPGIFSKLVSAVRTQLTFDYNAGPQVGGPIGGGGDGHSTDGAYEIMYKGKALISQAEFVEAIKEIALAAAGEAAGTVKGDAIIAHVSKQEFIDSILGSNAKGNYSPWKLESGGFENQTQQVLHGGTPAITDFLAKTPAPPPPVTEGARTKSVVSALMGANGGMPGKMGLISTRGDNANHAFNAVPGHPSQSIIAPPDTDAKIQTELVDKGTAIASKKLPLEQAVAMFEEQIRAQIEGKPDAERDLLVAALKNKPTTEMTPREIEAKVLTEMRAYRDASATRQANDWIKTEDGRRKTAGETALTNTQKGNVLNWFKNNIEDGIKGSMLNKMMTELAPPQVVMADSNWGGPEGQTYFVAMPDPRTGELKMWKKDMPGGKMSELGKNWADSKWAAIP